jgi:hypothetical protein
VTWASLTVVTEPPATVVFVALVFVVLVFAAVLELYCVPGCVAGLLVVEALAVALKFVDGLVVEDVEFRFAPVDVPDV